MRLRFTITRTRFSDLSTQGEWNFDGQSARIFSLEPPKLSGGLANVPAKTCVPPGLYKLGRHFWTHGRRDVLILLDVPGRSEILIHPMNRPSDTKGCIGAGYDYGDDFILISRNAVDEITRVGFSALDAGDGAEIRIVEIGP
jgi:hypothetical protein